MRTLASLEHYVVLSSADEIRVHQYIPGTYTAAVGGGAATLSVTTEYPWEGQVRIVIDSAPGEEWGLGVRVPHWAESASVQVNGEPATAEPEDGWLTVTRTWAAGDEFVLDLPLDVRFTYADPRVDAARGSVALERGPLVYCLEAVDNPGQRLDDIIIDTDREPVVERQRESARRGDNHRGSGASAFSAERLLVAVQLQGVSRAPQASDASTVTLVRRSLLRLGQPRTGRHASVDPLRVVSTSTMEAFWPSVSGRNASVVDVSRGRQGLGAPPVRDISLTFVSIDDLAGAVTDAYIESGLSPAAHAGRPPLCASTGKPLGGT